ncbi:MAG: HAD family phosphatase [Lachnospiraceae bacterium]|nr:HAD family phosphatase [Lachnospiraceae bacterium]
MDNKFLNDPNIKNIIFDMGDVLLDFRPWLIAEKYTDNEEDKDLILKELFTSTAWTLADSGVFSIDDRYDVVKDRLPERLHKALYDSNYNWAECMTPHEGSQAFVKKMYEAGYNLFVLSNASGEFHDYFPKFYDLSMFKGIVVSCDVKMLKPQIGIYKYLLDKYNLDPKECVFFDDRETNVMGAKNAGINAVLFEDKFMEV